MTTTRARVRERIPTLVELVSMALDLHDLALEATYERDGQSWPRPEIGSACKTLELVAKLAGYVGDGRNMPLDQLRSELDRLGYRLEPKGKLKAVGK